MKKKIKIGVTGHQHLDNKVTDWIINQINKELDKLNIELGYSSLAIGADQIFAEILIKREIPLIAIIPSNNYIETFNEGDKLKYLNLLNIADKSFILNFSKPTEEAFFNAGKKIADDSDILFAIWDGQPAEGLGGTGDIVKYMTLQNKKIIRFDILKKQILYINLDY